MVVLILILRLISPPHKKATDRYYYSIFADGVWLKKRLSHPCLPLL